MTTTALALRQAAGWGGVTGMLAPVPAPGTPPGTNLPGLAAAAAARGPAGGIVAVTRLAHAVPGKPDGEVDTRPLQPLWQPPARTSQT